MQFNYRKINVLLLTFLMCFMKVKTSAIPKTRTVNTSTILREQLQAMVDAVDDVLTDYIVTEMDCTSVVACRALITNLKLTDLPSFLSFQGSNSNWSKALQNNTSGLQDFNFYLQSIVFKNTVKKEGLGSGQPVASEKISPVIVEELKDITNLLQQFIITIVADFRNTYCINVEITELEDYPTCFECSQENLPSMTVQVTRNYQFLQQLYSFLYDFKNLYNSFLINYEIPETCS